MRGDQSFGELHATVVVLGDLGRSPRMQNHALELARHGYSVDLAGFEDTEVAPEVANEPRIRLRHLHGFERIRSRRSPIAFLLAAVIRQVLLACDLVLVLCTGRRAAVIVVQSPPAFPSLPIVLLIAALRRSAVVVDWHNTTAAMLRARAGEGAFARALVRLVKFAERWTGGFADAHLCVTRELADDLGLTGEAASAVVPDFAATRFRPLTAGAVAAFRRRYAGVFEPDQLTLIAPCSWGFDDDFELLFDALQRLDDLSDGDAPGAQLSIVITGDGERRASLQPRIAGLRFVRSRIRTEWFEAGNYPDAVASADGGLSLHRSASGLDFAMKVAEMLGCGIPPLCLDDACTRERVRAGEQGFLFRDAASLAAIFARLLSEQPAASTLRRMRTTLLESPQPRWREVWDETAAPLIERAWQLKRHL